MSLANLLAGGGWAAWTVAWLGTYLLHSTVLLAAAWAASLVIRSPGARDAMWKTATFGALLTASLHLATARPGSPAPRMAFVHAAGTLPGPRPLREPFTVRAAPPPVSADELAALWILGAVVGLAGLERGRRRYWREAGPRHAIADAEAADALRRLRTAAGVERTIYLTAAEGLSVPAAIGFAEICLPTASLDALTPPQRESVMAHELGHLVRRDPLLRVAAEVLAAVFFFQPLHRVARRELAECAELLCDGFAVRVVGRRRPLVESLGVLAAVVRPYGVAAAGFGGTGSPLLRRAQRVMDRSLAPARPLPAWARAGLGIVLIAATVAAVPGMPAPRMGERHMAVRTLKLDGAALDPARTGVARVDRGGSLRLVEDRDGFRRELTVRRGPDGRPAYDYRENGAPRPYDADARRWTTRALERR